MLDPIKIINYKTIGLIERVTEIFQFHKYPSIHIIDSGTTSKNHEIMKRTN